MRKSARMVCAACAAAVAFTMAGTAATAAATGSAGAPAAAYTSPSAQYAEARELIQRLTTLDGAPGALAEAGNKHTSTVLTSGVADIATGTPMAAGSRFRIGSVTKTFTATVVLQLVGERKISLD